MFFAAISNHKQTTNNRNCKAIPTPTTINKQPTTEIACHPERRFLESKDLMFFAAISNQQPSTNNQQPELQSNSYTNNHQPTTEIVKQFLSLSL
jgi:hypothetical protein